MGYRTADQPGHATGLHPLHREPGLNLSRKVRFPLCEQAVPLQPLIFLPLLLVLTAPVYLITSVVVWLIALPAGLTLSSLIAVGWKFSFVVTLAFGIPSFLYHSTKEHLERRNVELQQKVEHGTARLEMQDAELQRAREIQQSLLPRNIPQIPGFEIAGAWQPASMVSGDYYDVLPLGGHKLGICIADVAGRGISAALLMSNVQAAVRAYANESQSPAQVCGQVNRLLCENVATGKFVTFLYGILDGDARSFQYCNAGHLYPILVSRVSVGTLEQGGAVLGVFPAWTYEDSVIDLKAGDRLLLFTDGITEASDTNGQEFEETTIAAFAKANATLSASELDATMLVIAAD